VKCSWGRLQTKHSKVSKVVLIWSLFVHRQVIQEAAGKNSCQCPPVRREGCMGIDPSGRKSPNLQPTLGLFRNQAQVLHFK